MLPPFLDRFPLKIITINDPSQMGPEGSGKPFPQVGPASSFPQGSECLFPVGMPIGLLTQFYWSKGLEFSGDSTVQYENFSVPGSSAGPPDYSIQSTESISSSVITIPPSVARANYQINLGTHKTQSTEGEGSGDFTAPTEASYFPPSIPPQPRSVSGTAFVGIGITCFSNSPVYLLDNLYYPDIDITFNGALLINNIFFGGSVYTSLVDHGFGQSGNFVLFAGDWSSARIPVFSQINGQPTISGNFIVKPTPWAIS